jgi:hypothetical protein
LRHDQGEAPRKTPSGAFFVTGGEIGQFAQQALELGAQGRRGT